MLEILLSNCANIPVPEATEQAMRYYHSGNVLWAINLALGFIIPLLFLATGFSGVLGKFSAKLGRNWFFTIVVYLILYIAIVQLVTLPLDYYSEFIRQHEYGLSTQTVGRWFDNWTKMALLIVVASVAFVWIFYLLLKKSPRRWWLYSSLVSIIIVFFMTFIQPIWIAPLFNHFGPMKDKQLEAEILSLAARAGIADGCVFEVDKSQDTKLLNAYVTGFGGTKRIVLWDTIIQKLTPDQILFVMGHEMGHYVLHHLWWGLFFFGIGAFAVFYLTFRSAHFLLHRYCHRFGFSHLHQIASLPLLLLLIGIYTFIFSPISNYISRVTEHHADEFGLEITQNNQAAAEAFVALQMENLGNPHPGLLFKIFRCSHPPLAERIEFCNTYCPWTEGKPLKYGYKFSSPTN